MCQLLERILHRGGCPTPSRTTKTQTSAIHLSIQPLRCASVVHIAVVFSSPNAHRLSGVTMPFGCRHHSMRAAASTSCLKSWSSMRQTHLRHSMLAGTAWHQAYSLRYCLCCRARGCAFVLLPCASLRRVVRQTTPVSHYSVLQPSQLLRKSSCLISQ